MNKIDTAKYGMTSAQKHDRTILAFAPPEMFSMVRLGRASWKRKLENNLKKNNLNIKHFLNLFDRENQMQECINYHRSFFE